MPVTADSWILQGCRTITDDRERLVCYDAAVDGADPKGEAAQVLDAQVASVRTDAHGKLIVSLDNGQIWAQIDSAVLKLAISERVLIRRGSLGSYLLTRVDGGAAIRVRRSR